MNRTGLYLLIGAGAVGFAGLLIHLHRQDQQQLKSLSSKDRSEVLKARAYSNAASMILSGPGQKKRTRRKPKKQ